MTGWVNMKIFCKVHQDEDLSCFFKVAGSKMADWAFHLYETYIGPYICTGLRYWLQFKNNFFFKSNDLDLEVNENHWIQPKIPENDWKSQKQPRLCIGLIDIDLTIFNTFKIVPQKLKLPKIAKKGWNVPSLNCFKKALKTHFLKQVYD